ncbi:glutamate 5-kinase [Cohnella sp. CIP 111063]|uniref:glutamate 5-kinase n=1 Tax=unclassified Cohnella TaxID=2636738 RepID=UPI000B8C3E3C|nr:MULTISPECIES: glutamate 5-kinase [unclassified Cohnella]OXS61143.1 glutamate 5-kinase [Cohnella sp. CIP 111063]PRX73697.1 glutamate 5-kinase [Cohnella sp. SGD-V74]
MGKRIVVKIGSSSLTSEQGGLNRAQVKFFADELASLHGEGHQVLLVTSGAIAAGFRRLGYTDRPKLVHEKQAAASVGQALLMQAYQEALGASGIAAAQILLTRPDFSNRGRAQNATRTIEELLKQRAIPIINENDTVAVDEIKFGENDSLSALVANLVKADGLYILTDMDGLYTGDPRKMPEAERIERVEALTEELYRMAGGAGSSVGTGGMRSKLDAARIAMRGGVPLFVGRVSEAGDLMAAAAGVGKGTYFAPSLHSLSAKKHWVGFLSDPQGRIVVDAGAEDALLNRGSSLLPAGITAAEGDFHPGEVVEVVSQDGRVLGRGITNYAPWQITAVAGLSTDEARKRVDVARIEIIHRDEWVASTIVKEAHAHE